MARNTRNQVILAKIEATYGVDPTPTGAANAILCSKPKITPLQANNVDRDLVRPFLGGSEQLVGTRNVSCEIEVELAGSGTLGTAPAYGPLLRACALAEVLIALTRVDYTPITNGQESCTLYWYDDGVLHKISGARGNVKLGMGSGDRPTLMFSFQGLFSLPTAASAPAVDFSAFKTPLTVSDANTGDVTFGATVASTGAPAVSGGTPYPSLGLDLDLGNAVTFSPLLGGETVDITNRALAGSVKLDLTAAQEVSFYSTVLAATLSAMTLQHGTVSGYKVIVHQPSVQLYEPSKEEFSGGRRLIGFRTRGVPTPGGSGNDELRLCFF